MKWFMAAALSLTAFLAMARSVVAPVVIGPSRLEYLFLAPSAGELLLLAAAAAALILALRTFAIAISTHRGLSARVHDGRWTAPLCLLALSLTPLAVFIPGMAHVGSPFVYIGHDLRFWILAASLLLTARQLHVLLDGGRVAWRRARAGWGSALRLLAWDAGIVAVTIVWAIATMPTMRFTGDPHGDEPKYLRYAENWYQGHGFDLRPKQRMSDMPLDAVSRVSRNFVLLGGAIVEEAHALAHDLKDFAASPRSFRWNRARGGDNWFLISKRGGLYQVHTPGASVLIFPGYFLDRHFLDLRSGHQGEIPSQLLMTNVTLLLLYAAWAVVVFRLLRRLFGSERLAAALAVVAALTLPVTSFAFQLYPETAAGLALSGVLLFLLFPRPEGTRRRALAFGLLCGFLPWAHIRFSLLSLVLVAYALLVRPSDSRQRRCFLAGYALMLAAMCAYAYRLTGSPLPNAMFSAEGTLDPFHASSIVPYFVGFMVDRIWGILPHAPVYLLAFLGLGLLWRSDRRHAVLLVAIYLSLAIPSAAHSLNAAGGTPGRHLVAVLPLAAWPLGLAIRAWWGSRVFRTAFVTLTLLSLQAAVAYNWWHTKDTGRMWDVSISGWKVNLLFAWTHGDVWAASRGNFILFLIVMLVLAALLVIGFLRRPERSVGRMAESAEAGTKFAVLPPEGAAPVQAWNGLRASMLAIGLLIVAGAGGAAAALTGDAFREDYVQHPLVSRRVALERLAQLGRCTLCAASGRGEVDAASLTWHAVERFYVFVEPGQNRAADVRVIVTAKGREPGYGHVRLDFGDGTFSAALPVTGLRRLTHIYPAPGEYKVRAWLTLPDETRHETYTEVLIR